MQKDTTMSNDKKFWFPAKKYGWGWGFPVVWQGWVTLSVYILSIIILSLKFKPSQSPLGFILSIIMATLFFISICLIKGERPEWRWGDK